MIYFHKVKDKFSDAVNSQLESERINGRFTLEVHISECKQLQKKIYLQFYQFLTVYFKN